MFLLASVSIAYLVESVIFFRETKQKVHEYDLIANTTGLAIASLFWPFFLHQLELMDEKYNGESE